ncbi:MAG: hypothetical protein IH586_21050 [Anaerolineaceae bacterium]|nr:hypothetical protein [Anaerolineaceae bacterium]
MKRRLFQYPLLILISAGIIAIFLTRTLLAARYSVPRLDDLFSILTITGSLGVFLKGFRHLRRGDWACAVLLGTAAGVGMGFATLFSPYPFLGIVHSNQEQALVRGLFTALAALGGLVIMRQGGPVQVHAANGNWRKMLPGVWIGLVVGLPLAVLNIFALQITQGHPITWQSPISSALDALQPGIVEEVIYRFALWGLLWMVLQKTLPDKAVWMAGLLSMLVHNFSHFDDLFLQSPLIALGMGTVLALFWGVPPLILARRRGLESAIAFHWLQDAARFLAGF